LQSYQKIVLLAVLLTPLAEQNFRISEVKILRETALLFKKMKMHAVAMTMVFKIKD
jgi:hypothetical protein